VIYKQEQAHEDSIWSCAWRKNQNNGTDNIVTGSVDDTAKLWRWYVMGRQLRAVFLSFYYLNFLTFLLKRQAMAD